MDPRAQHEMNLMTETLRTCKLKKAGMGDLTCLMERCDGKPFVVRLSSGGKGVLAKQVLSTFCKQHVRRCPDDEWWANTKDCVLLQADEMCGEEDWELDPNAMANDSGRKQGHFLVRRRGQATSFAALARRLDADRDAAEERTAAEKVAATIAHFDRDAEKYMQLVRNVDQLADSGSSYGARCAHFLARPRTLLFEQCKATTATMRLLDVGCGCGRDAAHLAARGRASCPEGCEVRVVGCDAAPKNDEFCRAAARGLRVDGNCDFRCDFDVTRADFSSLRVDDAPFDGAMAASLMRYVPWSEHRTVWRSLRAVLAPGTGCLVVGEIAEDETRDARSVDGAHTEFRTWPDYKKNIERHGFTLESKEDYDVDKANYWVAVFRRDPDPEKKPPKAAVAAATGTAPSKRRRPKPKTPASAVCGLP